MASEFAVLVQLGDRTPGDRGYLWLHPRTPPLAKVSKRPPMEVRFPTREQAEATVAAYRAFWGDTRAIFHLYELAGPGYMYKERLP